MNDPFEIYQRVWSGHDLSAAREIPKFKEYWVVTVNGGPVPRFYPSVDFAKAAAKGYLRAYPQGVVEYFQITILRKHRP